MRTALIGYTGFVGSNIERSAPFDDLYNSQNIKEIEGKSYDLVISAGVRAEKYLANQYPEKDLQKIKDFIENLKSVKEIKCFVLISTIDVYGSPVNVDEDEELNIGSADAYGSNRLLLEKFVKEHFPKTLIVRLPALYGKNLKKNFLFDLKAPIPKYLTKEKMDYIRNLLDEKRKKIIEKSYQEDLNGNYMYVNSTEEKESLISILQEINCTSLMFTDARSEFQFYNLKYLYADIQKALANGINLLNISTFPLSAKEIAKECFGVEFTSNISGKEPIKYNMKSKYANLFGGSDGYLYRKNEVIEGIKEFAKE